VQSVPAASSRPRMLPDLGALRYRDYRLLWSGMFAMSALMPLQFITGLLFIQHAAPEDVRLLLAGVLGATPHAAGPCWRWGWWAACWRIGSTAAACCS
jgi:hypothetical protein